VPEKSTEGRFAPHLGLVRDAKQAVQLHPPIQLRSHMTVVNGLPAHALLVHFIVVLAPLTALLVMLCALWGPRAGI
jgi:hypothetical protein